jgi:hypothetical protein
LKSSPFLQAALLLAPFATASAAVCQGGSPEQRAVAYLSTEVPKWAAENHCYSCHNNGDAARALMAASKAELLKDREPLADTLRFLTAPETWDANGPEGPFKDKKLARIQFAAALADARLSGLVNDTAPLIRAAPLIAELQLSDGSWETDAPGTIGSPATYGRALATHLASRALAAADPVKYVKELSKAQAWFEQTEPQNVLSAAATLLALRQDARAATTQRQLAIDLVRRGQSSEGGWGPFVTAPPEVFDTALVVLALVGQRDRSSERDKMIARGRAYLLAEQKPDGSWPATTRPSGADSYAQQLSTCGWATQALLATRTGTAGK